MKKNNVTKIRLTPEEAEARRAETEAPRRQLTPKEQEQLAFKTGNRRTRRKIAKRNKFFKDHSGEAWRKSNEMIRTPNESDSNLANE
jgi:hypothetical protein